VWLRRYRQYGVGGLLELNRAAKRHPNQTCAQNEQAVIELRQAHMRWGPRKLKRILERDQPGRGWPATSTMGDIVKRAGLVVARKMMNLSSSFDHRVVDGMNAAEFIQQMRGYLECPGTLLLA